MSRALAVKFALSLVAVLILGQLQCAAACVSFFTSQSANASLPPCHRHHDSKNSGNSSDACSHEISASGTVAQLVSTPAPQFASIPIAMELQPAHAGLVDSATIFSPPPGSRASSVLRL